MAVEHLNLDPSDFTLGELEEVEKITGVAVGVMMNGGITAAVAIALAYVAVRRDDPSFTLDDARNIKVSALSSKPDPTEAAG